MAVVDELVSVLVPRSALADVYELVAQRERAVGADVPDVESETIEEVELDAALVRRMYDESEQPHRELMKLLATRPDEWMYTSEIAEEMQLENGSRSAAGMFGAFGRRAGHRYGGAKPWYSEWDGDQGEVRHRMSEEVAEVVNQL